MIMNQFGIFAAKRVIAGILMAGLILWGVIISVKYFGPGDASETRNMASADHKAVNTGQPSAATGHGSGHDVAPMTTTTEETGMDAFDSSPEAPVAHGFRKEGKAAELSYGEAAATAHGETAMPTVTENASDHSYMGEAPVGSPKSHAPARTEALTAEKKKTVVTGGGHATHETPVNKNLPKGVAFVEAAISPLSYELSERFWGWRPNDLIKFTDNVNSYQRGVLEVTRKTAFALAERISRTGSTEAFNIHLERAMNWLMVKADNYWFPSPETKYREALGELEIYKKQVTTGSASFYTRTDNLIPLLQAFENLLGSCEENLVKTKEKDGEKVSFFKADDYFFYAKGVASAMGKVLEAVAADFGDTIDSRRGIEVLHHAIESCHHATEIEPWIILNSKADSIFANHRANMAAPISHARFFVGVLIKAIST